ncbi:MAG: glycosyltransferase family 4 protein [Victivallaceae bacterium]|nr:glycosyltransferase family 4 protein [Victivallaceae bacterium]
MKKNLKIALIRKKYLPDKGGAEKTAARFVENFTANGHNVSLFSEIFGAAETDNLKWFKVPKSTKPSFCRTAAFHRQTQKLLSQNNLRDSFDIVYSMCRTYPVDIFRVTEQLHSKWLPIGYSSLARFNPRHRGILKLEKKSFTTKQTKIVVASSKFIKRQIIEDFDYPAENIRVIYNGMNHDKFYPASADDKIEARKKINIDPQRNICLFCAGNFKIKGLAEAIEVIASLKEKLRNNTLLLVVGGDKAAPFIKLAEEYGIAKNIVFAGAQKNMRDYYIASDILLYPSRYETFSNVCLESLGCGLPVITTRQIGAYELIDEAVNGFSVNTSDNVDEMSHFLSVFLELPQGDRHNFALAAAASVKDFTWEKHIKQLEALFYEVVELKKQEK